MKKTIVLYHGTNRNFTEFKIGKEYLKNQHAELSEGLGVYLVENPDFCKSYGDKIYEVEVLEENIIDFTEVQVVKGVLNKIRQDILDNTKQDIFLYFNANEVAEFVSNGEFTCTTMYDDIRDYLDANFKFHEDFAHLITYEDNCIYKQIENSFFHHMKDVVKNTNKSFKLPIYTCFRNPKVLKIVNIHNKF